MTCSVLAVIDRDGFVHAACEVEPTVSEGFVRLLGSWDRTAAPCLRWADVDRIVPVLLGDASDGGGDFASVAEWAEGRGYRMARPVATVAHDPADAERMLGGSR